jgi:hydroxyacylglutathione hydrolase
MVGKLTAKVIETPGHTLDHISYWFPKDQLAFVGDTLFSIGCGRVIEGNPEMMWRSLRKLRDLPNDTTVFCGHEYTAANVKFALTVDGGNDALKARAQEVQKQVAAGEPTIPVTIGDEKKENPFLRADDAALAGSLGMAGKDSAQVFAEIRGRKDRF